MKQWKSAFQIKILRYFLKAFESPPIHANQQSIVIAMTKWFIGEYIHISSRKLASPGPGTLSSMREAPYCQGERAPREHTMLATHS